MKEDGRQGTRTKKWRVILDDYDENTVGAHCGEKHDEPRKQPCAGRYCIMKGLFDFEQDGRYPLRRIPMIMRFKLDVSGMRIGLSAWVTLSRAEREELVDLPCGSEEQRRHFHQRLSDMLAPHAADPDMAVTCVAIDPAPPWRMDSHAVPPAVNDTLAELSLPGIALTQWTALSDLQRFALIKLTRSGHKNANLLPALKEFGLS